MTGTSFFVMITTTRLIIIDQVLVSHTATLQCYSVAPQLSSEWEARPLVISASCLFAFSPGLSTLESNLIIIIVAIITIMTMMMMIIIIPRPFFNWPIIHTCVPCLQAHFSFYYSEICTNVIMTSE